ncbi:MAG: hypothetical protein F6K62_24520 [Sphaerospermopsis sp. SIO1G2]|nr:hypothetical protein [Sphaerospermopsis sp. SIO1G2]
MSAVESPNTASARDLVINTETTTRVLPRYPDPSVENEWPQQYWDFFHDKVHRFGQAFKGKSNARNDGEGEKWGLPETFGAFIGGSYDDALAAMQVEDGQATRDHAHTNGIDFYWCFTLKGQVPKYFYYKPDLDPAYRQRMFDGGKAWTAQDPRPSLELVKLLRSDDPEVVEAVQAILRKMWRSPEQVKAMGEEALKEQHRNFTSFGNYMIAIVDKLPATMPQTADEWHQWWATIAGLGVSKNWIRLDRR